MDLHCFQVQLYAEAGGSAVIIASQASIGEGTSKNLRFGNNESFTKRDIGASSKTVLAGRITGV